MTVTTPTRRSRITVALGVTVAAALLGARCSDPPRRGYELTAVFDEQTKPTLPGESRSELRLLGAAPDGTLYIETYVPPGPTDTVWVRSPTGSYQPAPAELGAEWVEAMAFDPVTGDLFVLSYPEGRAHIRRFRGDRVVQDLVPTNPAGGNFEENSKSGGDTVGLFYDSSSGSLFYADGSLYRIDANGAAAVALSRPAPPDEMRDAADGPAHRDYSVAYALNPKTGAVYVAFFSLESTGKCLVGDVVYRLEANGQLTHVVGGCDKGKDDVIIDRLDHLAADPTSEDLITWGVGGPSWLSKGKSTPIFLSDLFPGRLPATVIRGVAIDGAGHAYVGVCEKVARITFRR